MHKKRKQSQTDVLIATKPSGFVGWPATALSLLLLLSVVSGTAAEADAAQGRPAWWHAKPARRLRASVQSSNIQQQQHAWHPQAFKSLMHASSRVSSAGQHSKPLLSQTAPTRKLAQSNSSSSNSPLTADDVASTNSTAKANSTGASSNTVQKPSVNPWYDQHLLGGATSWGSGVLYGMFTDNNKVPLNAGTTDTEDDITQAIVDPPPYEYPPVTRHPTVFFTAVLHEFDGTTGLRPEEQLAFSAAINAFLAPSSGAVITNTTVITQALASNGLWLPCATAFFTADSAVLQDYLSTTLRSDPNLILPTAKWGSLRTTNIKIAQPAVLTSISYTWKIGEYTNCSVMCGGGTQQRQVSCLDNYGNPADPSMCSMPTPASSRACQTQPCQASLPSFFELVLGAWSPCNTTCSFGGRTRTAMCVSKEGYIGTLSNCNLSPEDLSHQLWEACTLPPCPTFIWSYSDWICDNTEGCGGGTASRNASCIIASTGQVVKASMCNKKELDNATQLCAQSPCITYYWKPRELADCLPETVLKPCGRYVQRRGFDCVRENTGEVVTNNFCSGPRPILGEVECTKPAELDCSSGAPAVVLTPPSPSAAAPTSNIPPPILAEQTDVGSSTVGDGDPAVVQQNNAAPAASDGSGDTSSVSSSTVSDDPAGVASGDGPDGQGIASITSSQPSEPAGTTAPAADTSSAPPENSGDSNSDSSSSSGASPLPTDIGSSNSGAPSGSTSGANTTSTVDDNSQAGGVNEEPGSSGDGSTPASSNNSGDTADSSDGNSGNSAGSDNSGSSGSGSSDSSSAGTSDLGPGSDLPEWLLKEPTPVLKTLLECTGGYALSADGKCCSGAAVDSKGNCCDAGIVDACGVCNGTGRAMDMYAQCCSGALDAKGACCTGVIDECGVCNGTNACDVKAEIVGAVSPAVLFLMPASNYNRQLRLALQESLAAAMTSATGRTFEKGRVTVVLSAYSSQGGLPRARVAAADGTVITASEGWVDQPEPTDYDDQSGLTFLPPPVAALPRGGIDGTAGSRPVQMDSITQAPEQLDAPATHANLAAQRPPSANNIEQWQANHMDRIVEVLGIRSSPATQQVPTTVAGAAAANNNSTVAPASGVMRRLQQAWHALEMLDIHHSRGVAQSNEQPINGMLDSSNAIRVFVSLKAPAAGSGAEMGSALLAINSLVGTELAIPASRSRLTYKKLVAVARGGACGDGVCQVNERLSWNNPDSCQADCPQPFLSCPPFDTIQPPCTGLGVCYNNIGSCACTTGYAGPDCSLCASGYKRVMGFCVASKAIAPPRSDRYQDGSALAVIPPPRSMLEGQVAVTVVVLGAMALVAVAAVYVHRASSKQRSRLVSEALNAQCNQATD